GQRRRRRAARRRARGTPWRRLPRGGPLGARPQRPRAALLRASRLAPRRRGAGRAALPAFAGAEVPDRALLEPDERGEDHVEADEGPALERDAAAVARDRPDGDR